MFKKGVRINWWIVVGAFFILLPSLFKLVLAKPDHVFAASPAMQDPNFEETVLYMAQHTVDGAIAIVMNRPYPEERKEQLPAFLQNKKLAVFWGGPVADKESVWIMKMNGRGMPEIHPFDEWIKSHPDILAEVEKSPERYRLFVGAAGWGPLQFELERLAGAWVFGTKQKMIFDIPLTGIDTMWREFMKYAPESQKPAIPSMRGA